MPNLSTLLNRVATWLRGTDWRDAKGGWEPEQSARDAEERRRFQARQARNRARLERLEAIAQVRSARQKDDEGPDG